MNHHHYQQRLNHQQIQQQIPPSQLHGQRTSLSGLSQQQQHSVPQPIIPKQHLHQNIATLNQKPPQHGSSLQNSQIQSSQRFSYEKPSTIQNNINLKRESNSAQSVSAAAALVQNNSSIVTNIHQQHHSSVSSSTPQQLHLIPSQTSGTAKFHQPPPSIQKQTQILQHHSTVPSTDNNVKLDLKSSKSVVSTVLSTTPVVSANIKDILSQESDHGDTSDGIESLANTKEKTPMCLVNELARYNKIQHQYRLIGEQGPAHKKRFTVILNLGEEEYAAEGLSIKKAQHAAAKDAILTTSYKHPPLKTNRQKLPSKSSGNITPTVELNALAMKRGEPTVYNVTSTPNTNVIHGISSPAFGNGQFSNSNQQPPNSTQFNPRVNSYQQRRFPNQRVNFSNGRLNTHLSETFHVTLQVGTRSFSGMGPTAQAARHDAAARALEVLKPMTTDEEPTTTLTQNNNKQPKASENGGGNANDGDENLLNDNKSPISVVHELALKRKMVVVFEVQSEKGPPHMKVYTTLCKVGAIMTEGEGNGKKLSKKKAAEKMVDELKKLPPLSPVEETPKTNFKGRRTKPLQTPVTPPMKKKSRNLIKEKLEAPIGDEINPISQLIQIQQSRKEKEPIYAVIEERGTARRREFVIEVTAGGHSASGTGPNKKQAKRIAAENLLILMGVNRAPTLSTESAKENKSKNDIEKSKKVQFSEPDNGPKKTTKSTCGVGRQIVPGLLLVTSPDNFSTPSKSVTTTASGNDNSSPESTTGKSLSASPGSVVSNHDSGIGESGVSARDQLNYLAQLLGITIGYSDFPKGNHSEFLSLVTLSTDPPHMSHGNGSTVEESRDHAAMNALSYITELGLDNVKPKAK